MRKIFIALAAIAAVGCSKEMTPNDMPTNDTFALNASIVLDDTRVTIGGDKFTEVGWVAGDKIRVKSVDGFNAELEATESGRENIRFEGTEPYQAAVDTYYAVYPSSNINDAKVTFYLDNEHQPGDDVAALVAKAEGVESAGLTMEFKPVNSLLHVAVNGVESLSKAEFKSYTGKALVADFTYNYADDTIEYGTDTVASYEVKTPSADGFFFSLPADLDMSEGYVVTLTDVNGNVCAKAYNGMSFERGKTTRVNIEWSIPSVTLGVPMTSYSYYDAGDSATANSCANNVIYFTQSSTYANLQNAMVSEAGFIVDGKTYEATLDTATKSFSMGNVTVSSWGAKSVEAFVKTKDGRTIKSAPATVHITGLPYHADWRSLDYGDWTYKKITDKGEYLRVDNGALGCIISPAFHMPDNVDTTPSVAACTGATSAGDYDRCYMYAGTKDSSASESGVYVSIPFVKGDANNPSIDFSVLDNGKVVTLSSSNPCCVITAKDFPIFCSTNIYQAKIEYAK
ncbi:MAG: hypothetical protein IJE99_07155 [Alistipes sp.]|nr:hypothetical protein [Alistipes sp.]